MSFKTRYEKYKKYLTTSNDINKDNRNIYNEFFKFQEYKLKKINDIPQLDNSCYITLCCYITRIKNVNKWFKNKSLYNLTRNEIKQVIDDLDEGRIKTRSGKPLKDRESYYGKIFKSKLFKIAGKDDLARDILEWGVKKREGHVRFFRKEILDLIISHTKNPKHSLLYLLQFDVGENIMTTIKLTRNHFFKKDNTWFVRLEKGMIKRSRTARTEPVLMNETTKLLDMILPEMEQEEKIFSFDYRYAAKFLDRTIDRINKKKKKAICEPHGEKISWKDFRSSMACHWLLQGFSTDQVKSRLGHKPSSRAIDRYVNYLALDKMESKKIVDQAETSRLREQVEKLEAKDKMYQNKMLEIEKKNKIQQKKMELIIRRLNQKRGI